ncbi:murein L,D-transpeptidase [Nereida sp. MMG025]|uniref:L,D-transpeptidase family protein n=1 Tax=Nereida sp. MMG025 TaxID=2909981 RepID=UPI001F00FFEC|nr:L,D-transpeptidase family protein [Nereida sp. MMG025]MCF6443194.1 L,D-transpeptidase family protein [Nereida sp. MMG025]
MGLALWIVPATPGSAQVTQLKQAIAEAAAKDKDIAAFYKATGYKPLWVGITGKDRARRNAFLNAVDAAADHGLPSQRYDANELKALISSAKGPKARGALEVEMSRRFLQYARDIQTGILKPSSVDGDIVRKIPYRDRLATLDAFSKSNANGFIKSLPPKNPEYTRLMKAKLDMERQLARGGWGAKVGAKSLKPGQSGANVVQLRDRLVAMGFMRKSSSASYDANLQKAVQLFQQANGLSPDGVAGASTIAAINVPMESRLQQVIVAMERERWMNRPRGKRHVMVNLTDFTAKIVDGNSVTFSTRSVIGKNQDDRRSPEFSDVMEFMVINPSWYVPRSIVVKEYLPAMKRNRNANSYLEITDSKGRKVSRSSINFAKYDEKSFPYNMRQPPSRGNALGLVKFMFPNKYNIYLHDTPAKNLFSRQVRAFSHGCIRLNDPFDFAYALLAKQTSDPQGFFQAKLKSGQESYVNLKEPVPVHIMYRTAYTDAKGTLNFRNDIYGRDARIWRALSREGVALRSVGG